MADSAKKENKPGFFAGVKAEFSRISWPNKEDFTKQSVAVVIISVIVSILIALLDKVVQMGINLLSL